MRDITKGLKTLSSWKFGDFKQQSVKIMCQNTSARGKKRLDASACIAKNKLKKGANTSTIQILYYCSIS